jgi:hypothetical protein
VSPSPIGYMLTSSSFPSSNWWYILWIPLELSVNFLHSWTLTGYFSNSTDSFVTNCWFSPMIAHDTWCSSALTNILAWLCLKMFWGVCLCYTIVYKLTKMSTKWHLGSICSTISSFSILKCKHITLVISMFQDIFPLHTKMQHYHLKCSNVIC